MTGALPAESVGPGVGVGVAVGDGVGVGVGDADGVGVGVGDPLEFGSVEKVPV